MFATAKRLNVLCQRDLSGVYGSVALTGKSKNMAMVAVDGLPVAAQKQRPQSAEKER